MRNFSISLLAVCAALGLASAASAAGSYGNRLVVRQVAYRAPAYDSTYYTAVSPETGMTRPEYMEWAWGSCARLYPSFDPRTGILIGEDGVAYRCQ